ncbi:MAG: hypothetical protein K2P66_12270, partial [Lachnospiraceae bacterium]|nr:hypothetical protein [Lachnospiraceae bacterium]
GIRTHAPLRTNGFQDRLVMTTSIPLRVCLAPTLSVSAKFILAKIISNVNLFFHKFQKIFHKGLQSPFYAACKRIPCPQIAGVKRTVKKNFGLLRKTSA